MGEAIDVLERAGGIDTRAPVRSWLLVDLLAGRARTREARSRTDGLADGAMADVLRAHARRDPSPRLDRLRRAFASPMAPWAHLEAARALLDQGAAANSVVAHARLAIASGSPFLEREACLTCAQSLLDADRGAEAADFADRAAALDPADPRPPAMASRIAARRGRRAEAALSALTALRLQPSSSRAARRVADFLREDPGPDVEARVAEEAGRLARAASRDAEIDALLGLVAERAGDFAAARAHYRTALARGAGPIPVDRRLRVLLFRAGEVAPAIALLRRAVPPAALTDPENELRAAWNEVFARAAASPPSLGSAGRDGALGLATALTRVGAVEDALALLEGASSAEARAFRGACEREVAFERALKLVVEEGYRAPAEGREAPDLSTLLASIRDLARTHLDAESAARLADPGAGMRSVPMLGRWLDHAVDTVSPVAAHFRRFGKYVLVGQRAGKTPEVILLSLASLARQATVRTQGRLFRHDVAIGYDREIRGFADFQGGSLSGAALPDGVWLDADASRREDHGLRAALAADPTIGAVLDRAGADPSPADGMEGVFAMDETQALALRLVRRYLARVGDDPWGSFDVLRTHESGHVVDLDRHLPIAKGLPATASLLAGEGFAFGRVESRLEGRAQLAAMRDARDPDLALVDLVSGLPNFERMPEPHQRGYRAVVRALLERLYASRDRYPAVDPTRKLLPQLDRLSPSELRGLADDVARTGFTVR